jgi:hypothetical protein
MSVPTIALVKDEPLGVEADIRKPFLYAIPNKC